MVVGISARNLRKSYGGVLALDNITIEIELNKVHAILGENGAGKSTLVKLLCGFISPDSGEIDYREGIDPEQIGVVYQELSLIEELNVAENVVVSQPPCRGGWIGKRLGLLDRAGMNRITNELAERILSMAHIAPTTRVAELSPSGKQLVEIARAINMGSRVIMLDEPTSSLQPRERQLLFDLMSGQRAEGVGIILITHNLGEALQLSDQITVLCNGRAVLSGVEASSLDVKTIINAMTGGEETEQDAHGVSVRQSHRRDLTMGKIAFGAEEIEIEPRVRGVTLSCNDGEVLGLAGLEGSGCSELLRGVCGYGDTGRGIVRVRNCESRIETDSGRRQLRHSIGYIPADRKLEGLFYSQSIARNLMVTRLNTVKNQRWITERALKKTAAEVARELGVKCRGVIDPVSVLSGGNQQKVLIGRCLAANPMVIIADDPTRGVDVLSRAEIHRQLRLYADRGAAVIITSSDFDELVDVCDRIVILDQGELVDTIERNMVASVDLLKAVLQASTRS